VSGVPASLAPRSILDHTAVVDAWPKLLSDFLDDVLRARLPGLATGSTAYRAG
jgi:hypothetical protein